MTFRPSDDVLEELADSQNSQSGVYNNVYTEASAQGIGQQDFSNGGIDGYGVVGDEGKNSTIDLPVEEVKAPDLSEILRQHGEDGLEEEDFKSSDVVNDISSETINGGNEIVLSSEALDKNRAMNVEGNENEKKDYKIEIQIDEHKNIDLHGVKPTVILEENEQNKGNDGPIGGPLSFLIDEQWMDAVKKYKMLHRILFRWGVFVCVAIVGICLGIFFQTRVNQIKISEIIKEDSILNKEKWNKNTSDKMLSDFVGSGGDFEIIVPFGLVSFDGENIQSKSNLISYKGVILPQLVSLNKDGNDFVSLEDFREGFVSREDLENLLKYIVTADLIQIKTKDLPSISDNLWEGNMFNQRSLIDGFSLGCLDARKVSNFVCDYFVGIFYRYGYYYDLAYYANDVLSIMRDLKKQGKDVNPLCKMIIDYTQHSGNTTVDSLTYAMEYCDGEDLDYYGKLINFINVDNSLKQPELSEEVFEDPDLNAYKLLSAQQILYKKLVLKSVTEGYIESYLNYVQTLIKKDNGSNRYLFSLYKDITYIFNMDVLYPYLIENSMVNLRLQVDQINNGNVVYGYPSLLSQLTTADIIKSNINSSVIDLENLEIEDIFEQYYYMTDRLKIRKVTKISEDELKVQTELFTNKILSVTDGDTLKLTVFLYRNGNVLYVSNIKVANQVKLSEILNIYAKDGVTFYAMLNYIDEQIGMWYEVPSEESDQQKSFCDELQDREDIVVYSCDDESILLYKGNIEYNFMLINGILYSFFIEDEELDNSIHDELGFVMFTRENTPVVIKSIIEFELGKVGDENINDKLDIIDQFRIHFKIVPEDISNIVEGKDSIFRVKFSLGEFKLQANYDVETHLLTKISYLACDKTLEIRNLTIEISADNEPKLIEILNNPRVFFAQANTAAYKKYQRMCNEDNSEKNEK